MEILLQQSHNPSQGNHITSISSIETEKNIIKWTFENIPNLHTQLGKSEKHIFKSVFKQNQTPNQQKGRRVPLHLVKKVELESDKVIQV